MARSISGSTDTIARAIDLSAYTTMTFSWWMYVTTYGSAAAFPIPWVHSNGTNNTSYAGVNTAWSGQTGKSVVGFADATNTKGWQDGYTQPSTGVWHHFLWIADRPTPLNTLLVDGVVQTLTTVTHSGAAGVMGSFGAGTFSLRLGIATSQTQACRIAEFAAWSGYVGATAAEYTAIATALAGGASPPRVHPDNLVAYWPLFGGSPEPDYGGTQKNLTVTGTTVVAHPPVSAGLLPRKLWVPDAPSAVANQGFFPLMAAA